MIDVEYRNQRGELVRRRDLDRLRLPAGGARERDDVLTLDEVTVGDALPPLTYDVTSTTVVLGALAARDWRPMHHDYHFAVEAQRRAGHLPELAQPGRLVRALRHRLDRPDRPARAAAFRMATRSSPATRWCSRARCAPSTIDDAGCGWVELDVTIRVGDVTCTESEAKVAVPTTPDDNPWTRRGDDWRP